MHVEPGAWLMDQGEAESFREYVEATYEQHYRTATLLCRRPSDAEDLVQEAFIRLHRHWPKLTGRDEIPASYMYKIMTNLYRDYLKSFAARFHATPLELLDRASAANDIDQFEEQETLRVALSHLTKVQRLVLVYHHFEGLTLAEVGQLMNYSERHTRRLLRSAEETYLAVLSDLDVAQ